MALVAINQLPVTEETLWLRVLGTRRTQKEAIEAIAALPREEPMVEKILEILANWQINVQLRQNLNSTEEDKELIMNLSPAYLRWREETLQEGMQQGMQQGEQQGKLQERREMLEDLLVVRFGSLDEEIKSIIAPMLELPREELTRLLLTEGREQLLARFARKD